MITGKRRIEVRRNEILHLLHNEGMVSVAGLANKLDVTPATIRMDLTELQHNGQLVRVQGGAVLPSRTAGVRSEWAEEENIQRDKAAIAQTVCDLIRNGDTLFINSGTTTRCVAQALCSKKDLNVVTNSLDVATVLGASGSARVVLLGGEINAQYGFTCGGDAQEQLARYQADWVILSCEGVSAKSGITTRHVEEAIIDRVMIAGAKRVLLAADHRKIGRSGFAQVCQPNEAFTLVTGTRADEQAVRELEASGLKILRTNE